MQVGGQAGSQLAIVPMVSGTVKSEEGFEPKLDAELCVHIKTFFAESIGGADWSLGMVSDTTIFTTMRVVRI
jgi:hypothetical protein